MDGERMSSIEDLESKFKRALKTLEGEKRAAIKKAKATKGKKAKEAIASVESDFAARLDELKRHHEASMKPFSVKGDGVEDGMVEDEVSENIERQRKLEKSRRKRDRQKEKEAQRQREIAAEEANAGPSLRQLELDQIGSILEPLNLKIAQVDADGHCLYRAVAAQTASTYLDIRNLCADTLSSNQEEFAPFCEYSTSVRSFEDYVEQVRSSAQWGGHLELRALSRSLKRPIVVYSVQNGSQALEIRDDPNCEEDVMPIRLSYHLHYYALGEHYNQVVPLGA